MQLPAQCFPCGNYGLMPRKTQMDQTRGVWTSPTHRLNRVYLQGPKEIGHFQGDVAIVEGGDF